MPQPKDSKTRGRRGSSSVPSRQSVARPRRISGAANGRFSAARRRRTAAPLNVAAARRRLGVNRRVDVHSGRVQRGADAANSRFMPNMSAQESITIIHGFLSDCERNLAESHVQREQLAQMASQLVPLSVALARNQLDMLATAFPLNPANAAQAQTDIPIGMTTPRSFGMDNLGGQVHERVVASPEEALSHANSTNNRLGEDSNVAVQLESSSDMFAFLVEVDDNEPETDVPPQSEDNDQD